MENINNLKTIAYKAVIITFAFFILTQCQSQKKVDYELPNAMLPHVKPFYAAQCEKGKILYDLNCASCHTTKVKRKEIIPDFTPSQLTGYTLRLQNAQHEKNMPDSLVTEEELGIIMTFLSYKKKNTAVTAKK